MVDWSDLLLLTLDEATTKAERYGYKLRVTHWNKSPGVVTADYREDRLNVHVERNNPSHNTEWVVTKVTGVG